jgi:Flp pilus assembly protein TadD
MKNPLEKLAVVILAVSLLTSCSGLKKMEKNANLIRFKATPEILETHAGKVDVAVTGIFPSKYFDKKATMVVSPVLTYEGGETKLSQVNLQGDKIPANNKLISYDAGGNFSLQQNLDYKEEMRLSELVVRMHAQKGKKSVDLKPVSIGKGVLAASTLMANIPRPIPGIRREINKTGIYNPAIDPFQRIVPDEMIADISYLINSADLRKEEKTAGDVQKFVDYTKEAGSDNRKEVKKLEVTAYASPDGSLDMNTELASKREKVSTAFVMDELKKSEVINKLRTKYMPEDWEGFRQMMENSNIQDKDLILRVLTMYSDPEVREREIRNLSATFTQIAEEILPKLRRAKLLTSVNLIGKSDEEILAIAETNPESLNPAELLYAATLTADSDKKLKIYQSFSRIFPTDWRGPNNAGYVLAQQFKYAEAKPWFGKAQQLNKNEPIIKNNLGTVALFENNLKMAEEYFGAAAGLGDEVNYNLGLVHIRKGDYNKANQYFGNMTDPNTALVKILSGNYNIALRDLENFEKPDCYLKEYLKAIIGSRTNDDKLFFESLRNAMTLNPEWKAKARTEMEFAKYFDNPDFKAIIK